MKMKEQQQSISTFTKRKNFEAIIYEDGENADWKNSIVDYKINKQKVNSATILKRDWLQVAALP